MSLFNTGQHLPANTGTATATDPDGTPAITYTDVTVSTPCPFLSTITRTWSANDGCNPAVPASKPSSELIPHHRP
jgi:hypothetical protein